VDTIRSVAVGATNSYVKKFPKSSYVPDMLLFKAMMYNASVDFAELTSTGKLETYFDRVSPEAMPVYSEVSARFAGTAYGALARFEFARGTFQQGRVLDAQPLVDKAARDLGQYVPPDYDGSDPPAPANIKELYAMSGPRPRKLAAQVHQAMLEARALSALIADNLDFAGQPLERLAVLDFRSHDFKKGAQALLAAYPRSSLVDNVRLMLAEKIIWPAERASAIKVILDECADSDVRDAMLYECARALYLANLTGQGAREARPLLQELLSQYPQSTYRFRAVALLGRVNVAVAVDGGGPAAR
jgi:TolA-binding protein